MSLNEAVFSQKKSPSTFADLICKNYTPCPCFSSYKCTTLLLLFYKRFFCFCFAELGKDERFRGKFKKKEGNKTGLSIKKVPQRLKVAGDDPDAKMTGYLHKVGTLKEFQAFNFFFKICSPLLRCIYFFTSTKSNTFPPKNSN